ncbi:MAG: ABC transporter permease [Candidatus Rokubacteria bacterium]|nr:ABC transporter permease [Candidatus Rokubacteria bacterium]MBI3108776.1 ABC transporter permease [Candidatus Rokubacteria bacterium]
MQPGTPPRAGWHFRRWRRRGLPVWAVAVLVGVFVCAAFAEWVSPAAPARQDLRATLALPSTAHPLGTDPLGRDVLARVIFGSRISMLVGLASVGVAGCLGVALGLLSVVLPGWAGDAIMRLADMTLSLPAVLIALAVAATVGPSLLNVILIIGLLYWANFARMVRGEALSVLQRDFLAAARAIGCSPPRLLLRHVLPNVVNTMIVIASLQLAAAIILESTLSFLGVGVPPPTPTWGTMVAEGRPYLASAWWIVTFPGLAIMLTVLAINVLGDWIRDRLDPRLRRL